MGLMNQRVHTISILAVTASVTPTRVFSHTSISQCSLHVLYLLIWWQKTTTKQLSHCFNLHLSHLWGWVTFHAYCLFAFPLVWINSSCPLPIFYSFFFLTHLWDLVYRNIDSELNIANTTDNFMTLSGLITRLWVKWILNWDIKKHHQLLLFCYENAVQENTARKW